MPKINKRDIIGRLIEIPDKAKRQFWSREMSMLKLLLTKYPLEFINVLKFDKKYDSLAIMLTGPLATEVESRHRQWNYAQTMPKITVENWPSGEEKFGEDVIIANEPKTIKDFLNE